MRRLWPLLAGGVLLSSLPVVRVDTAQSGLVLTIADYATAPQTGSFSGGTGNSGSLARINFMRPEPGRPDRWWVNDLNGPLYHFTPATRSFTPYLDFNGRGTNTGLFDRFTFQAGFANGLITFQFDPLYPSSGRFYTLHLEDPSVAGSTVPDRTSVPGLDVNSYAPAPVELTPGRQFRESVLVEWTDTNTANSTFEGTAREVLRIALNTQIHPTGDLIFNPTARPGDPEWRVLYVASGDGGSGEQQDPAMRHNPQRLDTLVGKILRIVPDLSARTMSSTIAPNGRYRVPDDNPFVKVPGARGEVWAYGLRNPHRLTWVHDPARPSNDRLLALSVGLHTWETVNIVRKGSNYGYSAIEGTERLALTNLTEPRPRDDRLPVRVNDRTTRGTVRPTYPVLQYGHGQGLAILGGVFYQGRLPALSGQFVFGDIATGRLYAAAYRDLLAADDGRPETLAPFRAIDLRWDDPADVPDAGLQPFPTMAPIVFTGYEARKRLARPADVGARPTRADIRLAVDPAGELYILSKVDGMLRAVVGAAGP